MADLAGPTPAGDDVLDRWRSALPAAADPTRAPQMAAYMQDRFAFFGIVADERRRRQRAALDGVGPLDEHDLLAAARGAWALPEREYQYAACDLLRSRVGTLTPAALPTLRWLVTTRSWWDTVDALAAHVVGGVIHRHRGAQVLMDDWIGAEDLWLARTALLHQLTWKADTDADRLFAYCVARAADRAFFVRKAIGWALRQHARTDPEAVWAFVDAHVDELSPLSVREATRHR